MSNFSNIKYRYFIILLFFILIINIISCINVSSKITDDNFTDEINIIKNSIIRENNIKTVTIVRGQNYPPYHFIDGNGNTVGISVEIVKGVASMMGVEVVFKQYPWLRCLHLVNIGLVDAMANLFKTEHRNTFMSFYNNILAYETNAFWTTTDNNINYSGNIVEDIGNQTVSIIQSYSYGDAFDSVKDKLNIDETSTDEESLVRQLINNRTDIILGNNLVINWYANQLNASDKIRMLEPYVSNDGLYIGFSRARGLDDFAKAFSDNLEKFKQTEEYQKIINKYN